MSLDINTLPKYVKLERLEDHKLELKFDELGNPGYWMYHDQKSWGVGIEQRPDGLYSINLLSPSFDYLTGRKLISISYDEWYDSDDMKLIEITPTPKPEDSDNNEILIN